MKSRLTSQSESQPAALEKRSEEVLASAERAVEAALDQSTPGAPTNTLESAPPASRNTAPLPRRPKGRLPMVLLLVGTVGGFAYTAWNSIFRYTAYGEVTAAISQLPAPWAGTVQAVYVREGDLVQQGQPIAWMASREFQRRLETLEGERRLARARLIADTAQYWADAVDHHQQQLLQESNYLHMLGEVRELETKIEFLKEKEARLAQLFNQRAVSKDELQAVQQEVASLQSKLAKWRVSLERLGDLSDSIMPLETPQHLEPRQVLLENITDEIERIREQQRLGEITASVTGRVAKRRHFVGDYVDVGEAIIDIIPDGAMQVVVYWPQRSKHPKIGDEVRVQFAPFKKNCRCVVTKVGARHETVPNHLKTRYRAAELLLPIYLRPLVDEQIVPGQEVRVPRNWLSWHS